MRSMLKILLVALPLALSAAEASAAGGDGDRIVLAQNGGMSLDQAVEQVRRQYPDGRIISAETKTSGNREVHHVRVMVNGKVKTVTVNGKSLG